MTPGPLAPPEEAPRAAVAVGWSEDSGAARATEHTDAGWCPHQDRRPR
ncbi:MAG: hypothetical protein ACJ714_11560 [Ornithinibacter sp.]